MGQFIFHLQNELACLEHCVKGSREGCHCPERYWLRSQLARIAHVAKGSVILLPIPLALSPIPYLPAGLKSWELPTFPMFFQIPRTSAGYVLPLAHLRCPLLQGALQTSMSTPGHTFLCHYFACLSFLHLPWLQLDCVAISLHISLLLDCENHKAGIMSSLPSWDPAHQQVLSLPPMYSWSLSVFRVYHLLPLQSQGPAVSPERNSYLSTCFHFYLPMILTSPGSQNNLLKASIRSCFRPANSSYYAQNKTQSLPVACKDLK